MGLPILIEKLNLIRSKNPAAAQKFGFYSIANMLCLDEFLKFLALRPEALRQFKTLLQNLIVTSSASVSALQLVIAQLETANNVASSFINTFKNAAAAAKAAISPFPFGGPAYLQCPPIQMVKKALVSVLPKPDPASLLPGNAKKVAKKYKQASQAVKEMEYRIYRNQKRIADLKKSIEDVRIFILGLQGIVDAIGEQFGI